MSESMLKTQSMDFTESIISCPSIYPPFPWVLMHDEIRNTSLHFTLEDGILIKTH